MSSQDISDQILTDLSRLQFGKFLNVAAFAIFAFDYCLTFSSEVELVWGTKWETSRVVFTISRYLPFLASSLTCYDVLVNTGCGEFIIIVDVLYTSSVIVAEGILILRTYAMWGRSSKILVFLLSLAAVFIAGAELSSLLVKYSLPGDSTSFYKFYSSLCAYGSSRAGVFQYIFLMVYEIILQGMNSWRKFRTYRKVQSRVFNTLYWDGIMYMSWVILLSGANMSVTLAAPVVYIPALDTAQVAIHSVLSCRIFFNLRECDQHLGTRGDEFSLGTMHYRTRSTLDISTVPVTEGRGYNSMGILPGNES